ncbi:MAG: hypothetical protein M3O15_08330 [Acidobacteriota bacterium]|nr:hypothetical protein [Acidobacteriota bacterium]
MTVHRFRLKPLLLTLSALAALVPASPLLASSTVGCPFAGTPSDLLNRGIVVPAYPGSNVRSVQVAYGADTAGMYHITLQIRRGTFDGPIVGTSTVNLALPANLAVSTPVTFDFGAAPVSVGDTLTFLQTATGPGNIFFDTGSGPCTNVFETNGTTPPLDTDRRDTVGITVTQDDLGGVCIPNDSQLCLDNGPGDRRFKISMSFTHGGTTGAGQAIPLGSLGVNHGGLFWFFGQDNPEVLIKILNGCALNGRFWVFFDAGTNVGFTLSVQDTVTGHTQTYSNADNHAAQAVQDTSALPCT